MENVIQSHNQLRVTVKAVGLDERILKLFGEVLNKGDQGGSHCLSMMVI